MPMKDEVGGEKEEEDEVIEEASLSGKSEEDEEDAAEERSTEAAPGGRAKDPATLLEKCGTIRYTGTTWGRRQSGAGTIGDVEEPRGSRRSGALKTPMPMKDEVGGKKEEEDEVIEEASLSGKSEEDTAEERSTEAAPGGRAKDPATLLEKRGTIRCVSPPQ
ncbi:hypothetical protein NDU88_001839 [Pleurodeles waltl]|uniref:Uncharacterized protein n=1 Tax=Pleurodeles waltl TaxID=8319 RepID=A0AAV7M2A1_PLEWA|nr:hypothetical protein NDU88_001839 [Pleurodeles waltl]